MYLHVASNWIASLLPSRIRRAALLSTWIHLDIRAKDTLRRAWYERKALIIDFCQNLRLITLSKTINVYSSRSSVPYSMFLKLLARRMVMSAMPQLSWSGMNRLPYLIMIRSFTTNFYIITIPLIRQDVQPCIFVVAVLLLHDFFAP
jgi:hypothetical protein